jgi:CRP-like cAMP-binding protein
VEFRNFLLSAISKTDLDAIGPFLSEISLTKGQVLFEAGADIENVYFPSSAVLSVVAVMRDGRIAESNTIGREGCAGLLNAVGCTPATQRTFAQVPGAAFRLSAAILRQRLEESPKLVRLVFRHASAEAAQIQQFVACNVLHAAEQRLARWLLMTADRTGSDSFSLTQDYMAVMTGVQRTTVSAMASDFKSRGLIAYSRGNVMILDKPGLTAVACECAGVAHDLFHQRQS